MVGLSFWGVTVKLGDEEAERESRRSVGRRGQQVNGGWIRQERTRCLS